MVGDTLTASTPVWAPFADFSYQWLRDGQPIEGATTSSYATTDADLGHRISVAVTGTAAGHMPESRTSAPTQAVAARPVVGPPAPGTRHVTKNVKTTITVKAQSKRRIQVAVSAKGVPAARLSQTVTVRVAGVKKTYRVRLVNGKATIRLTGAATSKVRTGRKVRVTVLVPRLTTTTATAGVVTTYQLARATTNKAIKVRR
jgi:hypothetical protein